MDFNAQKINGVREFLKLDDFTGNVSSKQFSESYLIEQANRYAKIPARFSKTRLSDYPNDFTQHGMNFALKVKNDKIFVLAGPSGSGKTTFLTAMQHERAVNNLPAGFYFSARRLAPMLSSSRSFSSKVSEDDVIEMFCTVPFLIFDEFGTCEDPQLEKNFFRTVLACRYDNELPMGVGTNFSPAAFKSYVSLGEGDPIMDRLESIVEFHALLSESHR